MIEAAAEQCNEPDEVIANGLWPSQVIAVFYVHRGTRRTDQRTCGRGLVSLHHAKPDRAEQRPNIARVVGVAGPSAQAIAQITGLLAARLST